MRVLLLFRGAPGCGKSTYIEDNGLKPYTLCADDIRLMCASPTMDTSGFCRISQENDKLVWKTLFQILETRMQHGEFTVIDATNSKTEEMKRYRDLADQYRYRIYCIDMTGVPRETLLQRNMTRPFLKQVPEEVIDKMLSRFETQKVPAGIQILKPDELYKIWYRPADLSDWKKIHVIGDIHGCNTALQQYFAEDGGLHPDELYIFTGDYVDRGIENAETVNFLISQTGYKNMVFLEGNHECFHKNTEVLTKNGWKYISDIQDGEMVAQFDINTSQISFAEPESKICKHAERLLDFHSCDMRQIVTSNHDVVYKNAKIKACDLMNMQITQHGFTLSGFFSNDEYPINDDVLKMIVWIVCDGAIVDYRKYTADSVKRRVQFHLSNERKISDLRSLMDRLHIKYTITAGEKRADRNQSYMLRFYGDDARYYCDDILCSVKHFPLFFRHLNRRQALIVLDELVKTDATQKSNVSILWSCVDKNDVDIIQEMCILNNISCSTILRDNSCGYNKKGCIYEVRIKPFGVFGNNHVSVEEIEYNDDVYCLSMPEGTLITRYEGKVAFSGNCHLWRYANDEIAGSKEFEFVTKPQLDKAGVSKKNIREFYRRLCQCAYFTYYGKTFLITHGGLANMPVELTTVATDQLIRGTGRYSEANLADESFCKHTNGYAIQIHGHRNVEKSSIQTTDCTYNLEGDVERGGFLRAVQITKEGITTVAVKNEVFQTQEEKEAEDNARLPGENVDMTTYQMVHEMRGSRNVKENRFGRVSSFNFTRQAFNDKAWDSITTKARGLFIDNETYEIVARSYDKFFAINERPETSLSSLRYKLHFPVKAYVKENGFLGIVGRDPATNDLLICSKSTPRGPFADIFRENLYRQYGEETMNRIKDYILQNNVSFVFECCDMEKDPHIIEYPKSDVVLLDVIKNQPNFEKLPYEDLRTLAKDFGLSVKHLAYTIDSWEDFVPWFNKMIEENYTYGGEYIEGFVLEDAHGFMTKMKLAYYKKWKTLRGVAVSTLKTGSYKYTGSLMTPMENAFYGWCKHLYETMPPADRMALADQTHTNICTLRKQFLSTYKEGV